MNFKTVIIIILSIAILASCKTTPQVSAWEIELHKAANHLNASLPMMVDAETRLDSTVAIQNSFNYRYTLIHSSIEKINIDKFTEVMNTQIFNNVCTNPDMAAFVNNKTQVNYYYVDSNSKHIAKISIDTKTCSNI